MVGDIPDDKDSSFYVEKVYVGVKDSSGPNVTDPGSPYVATFHCVIFLLCTSFVFYKLQTGRLLLLEHQTKIKR